MTTETLAPRWAGRTVIIAAPGPSLTAEVAAQCRGVPVVAVQDAYRMLPRADVLYGCENAWWRVHDGCSGFAGEKWSTHDDGGNDKRRSAERYGLRLVRGATGEAFSTDPRVVHYGRNSGFQAVGMALLWGAARVVLVGFDMRAVDGRRHFFGDHPKPLRNPTQFSTFIRAFEAAMRDSPPKAQIINATPGSALKCFPFAPLSDALCEFAAA